MRYSISMALEALDRLTNQRFDIGDVFASIEFLAQQDPQAEEGEGVRRWDLLVYPQGYGQDAAIALLRAHDDFELLTPEAYPHAHHGQFYIENTDHRVEVAVNKILGVYATARRPGISEGVEHVSFPSIAEFYRQVYRKWGLLPPLNPITKLVEWVATTRVGAWVGRQADPYVLTVRVLEKDT